MLNYEFSIVDLFPYLFSFLFFASVNNSRMTSNKKLRWMFLYVLFFSALRYGIGYDYFSYKNTIVSNNDYQLERIELLGSLLMKLSYRTHYQLFFIITSILTLCPLFCCLKKYSSSPIFSFWVYLLFPLFYLNYISIVRNAVAYSFGICFFFALVNRKGFMKFFYATIFFLLAFGFHKSSLILVLMAVLIYIPVKKSILFVLFCLSFLVSNYIVSFLGGFSNISIVDFGLNYLENHERSEGHMMTYVFNAMCLFTFVVWDKVCMKNERNSLYLKLCCIGTCLWNIFLPLESTMALRLSSYFTLFYIFLIPEFINIRLGSIRILKSHILSILLLLIVFTFYRNIDAKGDGYGHISFLPYQTVFFHTDYRNYQD